MSYVKKTEEEYTHGSYEFIKPWLKEEGSMWSREVTDEELKSLGFEERDGKWVSGICANVLTGSKVLIPYGSFSSGCPSESILFRIEKTRDGKLHWGWFLRQLIDQALSRGIDLGSKEVGLGSDKMVKLQYSCDAKTGDKFRLNSDLTMEKIEEDE